MFYIYCGSVKFRSLSMLSIASVMVPKYGLM
jgi:hypothetical protein